MASCKDDGLLVADVDASMLSVVPIKLAGGEDSEAEALFIANLLNDREVADPATVALLVIIQKPGVKDKLVMFVVPPAKDKAPPEATSAVRTSPTSPGAAATPLIIPFGSRLVSCKVILIP